jgi:hypothetical protein
MAIQSLGTWAVTHTPAANTQATASQASAGSGIKNVCTGILVTLAAGASAPTAVNGTVNLRDGATGAGDVLWSATLSLAAVAGDNAPAIALSGLWIEGTAATAMTLEFAAAGGANTVQSVAMTGTTTT